MLDSFVGDLISAFFPWGGGLGSSYISMQAPETTWIIPNRVLPVTPNIGHVYINSRAIKCVTGDIASDNMPFYSARNYYIMLHNAHPERSSIIFTTCNFGININNTLGWLSNCFVSNRFLANSSEGRGSGALG